MFPHLSLVAVARGNARYEPSPRSKIEADKNRTDRQPHAQKLETGFQKVQANLAQVQVERLQANLPTIPGGVPFVMRVEEGHDGVLDFLAEKLGIEVVAEFANGFLLVASESLDLTRIQALLSLFRSADPNVNRGTGAAASIFDVLPDLDSPERLQRILPDLIEHFPFPAGDELTLEVSLRNKTAPKIPHLGKQRAREEDESYESRKRVLDVEVQRILEEMDEERMSRETALEEFVQHYQGALLGSFVDSTRPHPQISELSDSFSVRVRMSGAGFNDLVYNFAYLFEVTPTENCGLPISLPAEGDDPPPPQFGDPLADSPAVCVIDSGIQENHRWLQNAVDGPNSKCFFGEDPDDVADYVDRGGHGTRSAGAVLYGRQVPLTGLVETPFFVQNARLLNEQNALLDSVHPPAALQEIVAHYRRGSKRTRIFNHSIASERPCRLQRMSAWAATIDELSHREDVLFIQAAGNIRGNAQGPINNPHVADHLAAGREYPGYLLENSSRISNPAQSLQALTVGSIALATFNDGNRRSIAQAEYPSAFSRTGYGMWNTIKPEVVEFGGDFARNDAVPPQITRHPEICPSLVRSTYHDGGPAVAPDAVGTSFAAPIVANLAGLLAVKFPTETTLLYRALIAQSARWPDWAEEARGTDMADCLRHLGYGVPDISRATENDDYRITLITSGEQEIEANMAAIFAVPIPEHLRGPALDADVRIDVTLSYSALPRRTRSSRRGYLAVWLDWISGGLGEPLPIFQQRALKTEENAPAEFPSIPWVIGARSNYGEIHGVSRHNGTLQKDWATVKAHELPNYFTVAVRGHKGWAHRDPTATARFSLAVTLTSINRELPIYTSIQQEIERIEAQTAEISV